MVPELAQQGWSGRWEVAAAQAGPSRELQELDMALNPRRAEISQVSQKLVRVS